MNDVAVFAEFRAMAHPLGQGWIVAGIDHAYGRLFVLSASGLTRGEATRLCQTLEHRPMAMVFACYPLKGHALAVGPGTVHVQVRPDRVDYPFVLPSWLKREEVEAR